MPDHPSPLPPFGAPYAPDDRAIAAGLLKSARLTQAQEDKILAALPTRLDQEINETHTGGPSGGPGGRGGPPPADSSEAPAAA